MTARRANWVVGAKSVRGPAALEAAGMAVGAVGAVGA